jgi:hypothetical protein
VKRVLGGYSDRLVDLMTHSTQNERPYMRALLVHMTGEPGNGNWAPIYVSTRIASTKEQPRVHRTLLDGFRHVYACLCILTVIANMCSRQS